MARENNFLLGNGERLTTKVTVPTGGGPKNPPYDFQTARKWISKDLALAAENFKAIPAMACPEDLVTATVTMHPRYISKSDFPNELFNEVGLKPVGGRSKKIKPRQWGIKDHPDEVLTDEILVMGTRRDFSQWAKSIPGWSPSHRGANHLPHIEDVNAFMANAKIQELPSNPVEITLEIVLHDCTTDIIDYFDIYAKTCDARLVKKHLRFTKGLAFIPVETISSNAGKLAAFSFIRVVRAMPHMRPLNPNPLRSNTTFPVQLPQVAAINPDMRVAIFDGGIPTNNPLTPWVKSIEPDKIGPSVPGYLQHGLAVTSAFLFGPLEIGQEAPRPLCNVDHIRVIDKHTGKRGDYEYYDVLDRILDTLDNNSYDFANISLGPDMPINDDDITRWTASLDQRFAGGNMLTTIAAGNSGDLDALCGLNRIQPPSDAVNVIAVGACDQTDTKNWARADYSCMGPGRSPGFVKPDGVIFGGSDAAPFMALSPAKTPTAVEVQGTSFASPYALRSAISVQAQLGIDFHPLAIRALLIHRADRGPHDVTEVGWGRFETDYGRLITCDDDEALIIYQGNMPVKEHLRAPIPLPDGELQGMIEVTATLVIAPEVDPSFPNAYTRAGLEVAFRPNSKKLKPGKDGKIPKHAGTKSFFSQKNIYGISEFDLRGEGQKWEPCLKATQNFRSTTLIEPCFDIYYHNREEGMKVTNPAPIPYVLIVSVKAPKVKNFYDRVVRTYANILLPIRPQFRIQLKK